MDKPEDLIDKTLSTLTEIRLLKLKESYLSQIERIRLTRLNRKLALLTNSLGLYINPKIYKVTLEIQGKPYTHYLANVDLDLIPRIMQLCVPGHNKILEIQELGKK